MSSLPSMVSPVADRSFAQETAVTLTRHWFPTIVSLLIVWTGLPFLAPLAMHLGWTGLGAAIYAFYSFQCHQLPERSFFLFGPKVMYSLAQIQDAWMKTTNPALLRQFVGNPEMGWKVAWSDRMVAMYTSIPIFALLYFPLRRKIKPLPVWIFVLLLSPMALDGGSHLISDMVAQGFGAGFRDTNAWLVPLTRNAMPAWFYAGDALGSFNSWMRIISGVLFGLGLVWLAFPYVMETAGEPKRSSPSLP
jgi:uncharacterized membrane protein